MKKLRPIVLLAGLCICAACHIESVKSAKLPVDYVNPYIGNVSHLLVPTFPTVQLPNSMLRVYPERADFTTECVNGLPVIVTNHRERSAFNLMPVQSNKLPVSVAYNYDNEVIRPYEFSVELDDNRMKAEYAVAHQSAIYQLSFEKGKPVYVVVKSGDGRMEVKGNVISGYQKLDNRTKVYLYMESEEMPIKAGLLKGGSLDATARGETGQDVCAAWRFKEGTTVHLRYGVSFISIEQAEKNLRREIKDYDVKKLAEAGRKVWNETLSKIRVEGGSEADKTLFYSSFYRTFERPVCLSEDGRYFSAFDGKVHEDNGIPFYTDDWIWDTYRAAHPLRVLIEPRKEEHIIHSYLVMAGQMEHFWMPTFPEVTGDSRRMNSNHGVATVADAIYKGLNVDTAKAFEACRKAIEEKTLAPWSAKPAGDGIDRFYKEHGYIPALRPGEKETDGNVTPGEKRQPIAVTLGTSYDEWCLSRIATALGRKDDAAYYLKHSYNYRNVFNPATGFFHPKDKEGQWIEPFDYRYSGGMGAREYYGENNGWVYRWDVPHNIADLIKLMGGKEHFVHNLDSMFAEPLGKPKYVFYAQLPDHTGNVGQFSMANEPSLHIPYLYNYAGKPWKTQKRIRQVLTTWFRPDVMGMPGDEDGGGMTSFVVFSALGFYPVTPGLPAYNIGSPLFTHIHIQLANGKVLEIEAPGASATNKYIQKATLNGRLWNKAWFSHHDIENGGKLVLEMGSHPNKSWGVGDVPPSAAALPSL